MSSRRPRASKAAVAALLCWVLHGTAHACVGDCDGDGRVSVTELVVGVNIYFGDRAAADCAALSAGAAPGVYDLVRAVRSWLEGCAQATPVPHGVATERFLGSIVAPLIEVVATGSTLPAGTVAGAEVACAYEGTASVRCASPIGDGSRWEVSFEGCEGGFDGRGSVALDGFMGVDSLADCSAGPAELLTVSFRGTAGAPFFDVYAEVYTADDRTIANVSGTVEDECLGGEATVAAEAIVVPDLAPCPSQGAIHVRSAGHVGFDRILFSDASVEIDLLADDSADESFDSCGDPRIERCLE